jgi:hypothetical protein
MDIPTTDVEGSKSKRVTAGTVGVYRYERR